ncbi:hypothetical protein NEMIN01_2384, partial [Nematocida minor]|uniref:uncharacterized protein n=1 Tax=Nematocida minor TaxID=1912983 RepID=UPI002220F519
MNYERKDQDDFEDILKNLVPYDEAEDRANSAQEEDLEVFDMSMVENDLSSDYTADNFFITKPEQNKTQAEPEKKNSSDEQSALKVNSETPIYHTEREDSYSNYIPTDSYSPTDGQIEDSNQVDEGMDNSYSEMNNYEDEQVNYGEIDNNHQMNNSYEHYANNGYEQANNEQVNNDYQMNNSYNFSYNPANTQVNNQQEIDNFSYSPTGNVTNDNGFEYEHSPADSQARSIQVGDTFEYTPADEQGSQPNINQLSNAADSSGPIRHLNNSLWHDSSADGSSGISHQNKLPENDSNNSAECNNYNSNHEIFQPVPASFNSSPASNWTMEEYFNQEESADDEQSASNSDTINNYVDGFDNYSNDETNSVCNISSSTHSLTPEREVQNNPESIEIAKDEESPHATSTEESSLDELFKDCPPIDPNTFKYQPHQQTQQTYEYPEEQHNYYADQQQTNSYNVDQHSLDNYHNDQPTIDYQNELPLASYYNNQPTIDYQNELPLASYYNDQPVDYPVEQSSYTVEEANYEQPLVNSYSGQTNYHMDKQTSIPTSPFQHSTKPIPVEPLYTYHLPSSGAHTVPLQTVPETVQSKNKEETEHLSSAPSALIQLAFCSDRLIIASSTGSITNASHLMANPIKTVELQGEIEVVSIK